MSNSDNRLYLRSYGAVIPSTAIGTILFTTWSETSYVLDRSERILNPLVHTIETVHASAIIQILDEKTAKQLVPEDEDDEEEEEVPVKTKRGRGRPAKVEAVSTFEPIELEIVFFQEAFTVASEPLNVSAPIEATKDISDKNESVLNRKINHYSGLFSQLEAVRDNITQDVSGATDELSAVVEDLTGGGGAINGLQQSALEEYRAKQRRQEGRIIADIDEALDAFQTTINKRGFATEAVALTKNFDMGGRSIPALDVINKFFSEELVSLGE